MSEHKPGDGASPRSASKGAAEPLFGDVWEDALRAGQEAEGERGSVEPELAVLQLLRHTRAPDPLPPAALDEVWAQIEPEISTLPWWKRMFDWRVGVAAAAAAAAIAVMVIAPTDAPQTPPTQTVAQASPGGDPQLAASLQSQFDLLAPGARDAIDTEVDAGRGNMRNQLVAELRGQPPSKTPGGAP